MIGRLSSEDGDSAPYNTQLYSAAASLNNELTGPMITTLSGLAPAPQDGKPNVEYHKVKQYQGFANL